MIMNPRTDPEVLVRLETAFEMFRFAESMKRQQLRALHPQATEVEVERRLLAWLHDRPPTSPKTVSEPG